MTAKLAKSTENAPLITFRFRQYFCCIIENDYIRYMRKLILLLLAFTPMLIKAQTNNNIPPAGTHHHHVMSVAEPQFPGGYIALTNYFQEHIKYPEFCKMYKVDGKVYVKFVVTEDGSVTEVAILHGVEAHLDEEAIRVVKAMPKWTPGNRNGVPVKSNYTLPVNFVLPKN